MQKGCKMQNTDYSLLQLGHLADAVKIQSTKYRITKNTKYKYTNTDYSLLQLGHLATPSQEFNREEAEKQRRMMEGSPPTPRSLIMIMMMLMMMMMIDNGDGGGICDNFCSGLSD